ncbi:hypothetical protein AVEN_268927-1 [Araneus ventricosus]|uniref:Uncharacterized protein n=1 Tax=Araneus ventricosus TaxID=182803 RepID=A0A4Y2KW14_ARAVE|nr:hypothetical protein AVEN_268927-1 [Araneus ventricosus]
MNPKAAFLRPVSPRFTRVVASLLPIGIRPDYLFQLHVILPISSEPLFVKSLNTLTGTEYKIEQAMGKHAPTPSGHSPSFDVQAIYHHNTGTDALTSPRATSILPVPTTGNNEIRGRNSWKERP